jgi:hypothetical protein
MSLTDSSSGPKSPHSSRTSAIAPVPCSAANWLIARPTDDLLRVVSGWVIPRPFATLRLGSAWLLLLVCPSLTQMWRLTE